MILGRRTRVQHPRRTVGVDLKDRHICVGRGPVVDANAVTRLQHRIRPTVQPDPGLRDLLRVDVGDRPGPTSPRLRSASSHRSSGPGQAYGQQGNGPHRSTFSFLLQRVLFFKGFQQGFKHDACHAEKDTFAADIRVISPDLVRRSSEKVDGMDRPVDNGDVTPTPLTSPCDAVVSSVQATTQESSSGRRRGIRAAISVSTRT